MALAREKSEGIRLARELANARRERDELHAKADHPFWKFWAP